MFSTTLGTTHITGSVRSKNRMVRGLTPSAKRKGRSVLVMVAKRKVEEMIMLLDILRLTYVA